MSIWDDPTLTAGQFVKWETEGDSIAGDVIAVAKGEDLNGNTVPQLTIRTDDGDDRTVTASQAQLKAKLAEERPEAGDRIRITYTGSEKRDGGKTLKKFTVEVSHGGAKGTVAAAPATNEEPF